MDANHIHRSGGEVPMDQQPLQGGDVKMSALPWSLSPDCRRRIINNLIEALKKRNSFSGQEQGLQEINRYAEEYEEKVYSTSTSRVDYRRRICMEMAAMKTRPQSPTANSLQTNAAVDTSRNSSDLDSTAQIENTGGEDWQEEIYQKIKSLKETYLLEMNEMSMKIATKLHQHETLTQQPKYMKFDQLKISKLTLEHLIEFLQLKKNDIHISDKDRLDSSEKHIVDILLKCRTHDEYLINSSLCTKQLLKRREQLQGVRSKSMKRQIHRKQILLQMKGFMNQTRIRHRQRLFNSEQQRLFNSEQQHEMSAQLLPRHTVSPMLSPQVLQVQSASPQGTNERFDSPLLLAEFTSLDIGVHGNSSTRRSNTDERATDQLIKGLQNLMHTEEIDLKPKETVACEEGGLGGQAAAGADEDMNCT